MSDIAWTAPLIAQLTTLWAEGLSATLIGQRMGIGRNVVLGKAHRLNLPARPSPAPRPRPDAPPKPAPKPRPVGKRPTIPAASALDPPLPVIAAPPPAAPPPPPPASIVLEKPSPAYNAVPPVVLAFTRRCDFPLWPDDRSGWPDFPFCGAPASRGAYCAAHAALCYLPVRQKPRGLADGAAEAGAVHDGVPGRAGADAFLLGAA